MQDFISKQFFLFLLAGGTAALINFLSRIIYNQWMSFSSAVIVAYLTGMIVAFILMRLFVFKNSQRKMQHSMWIFALVNLAGVAQVWIVSVSLDYYLLPWLGITTFSSEIAHSVGIAVPAFTSYLGHKYWSFSTH